MAFAGSPPSHRHPGSAGGDPGRSPAACDTVFDELLRLMSSLFDHASPVTLKVVQAILGTTLPAATHLVAGRRRDK
jgi:hypothetical protein